MKKQICITVIVCLSCLQFTNAQVVREKRSLDEDWKFHLGNASNPALDFNFGIENIYSKAGESGNTCINPTYNDSNWNQVNIPHDWAVSLPFEKSASFEMDSHGYKAIGPQHPENNIGWYRKSFTVAQKDSGNKFVLQFDGVYRECKVFINGHYLGSNFSGYMGFELDVTDYLQFRKPNVITVRVDASQFEGWFYEGAGIYRHVWLNKTNPIHIASNGIFVHTKQVGHNAVVSVETSVQNQNYNKGQVTVQSYIIDKTNKKVAFFPAASISLTVNEIKTIHSLSTITNPHLWNLENPYQYRLVSIVKSREKTIDSLVTRFGVRTITIDKDKGLFVNGKHIKIQGTCNHQDHAGVGSALPDALQYYRIKLLKEMGVNAYRTSHNPPTPELLDACDELGMLVLDENRLLGSSQEIMGQFDRLILRDRNHPSVFMWSIANEEHALQWTDVATRIARTLIAKQKELDPTRTSTYAANMGGHKRIGILEAIPVRGFNYYVNDFDGYRTNNPDRPIMGTEMGSTVCTRGIYFKDTARGYVPDYDTTFPPWATTAERWWKLAADREWFMGGFVWTGFDYRGEPTPYTWPCINSHFGIMDMCGFPKNLYYYYQSWWTEKDVLHIYPHWNWKGKEGQPIEVACNSNADEVELFLNGKSLGKKTMPRNSHLSWMVQYQPGILKAIGWKKGRILETSVETTGEPYQVKVIPDRESIHADGKDVSIFNITVTDKQGREVPDAMNLLHFTVSGEARIIGVGNGDPSSHEADQYPNGNYQRSLFNGKCQVIVQSSHQKGMIHFEASGDGLIKATSKVKAE